MKKDKKTKNNIFLNINDVKKHNAISKELEEKIEREHIADEKGNISTDYVLISNEDNTKIIDILRVDNEAFIKMLDKSIKELSSSIIENFDEITKSFYSPSKLFLKSDVLTYYRLHNMVKFLIYYIDMESIDILREKYGDEFFKEIRKFDFDISPNVSKDVLKETFLTEQNYFASTLNFLLNDILSRLKFNSSGENSENEEKNYLCLLQLCIHRGLLNKKIKEVIDLLSKQTQKKELIERINKNLREFGYEEIKD